MNTDINRIAYFLERYLKQNHGITIEKASKEFDTKQEYIKSIVSMDDNKYQTIDGMISFKELGKDLCVICCEHQDSNSMTITLPEDILVNRTLDSRLEEGIKGHKVCYESTNLFFRIPGTNNVPKITACINCSSFRGEPINEDEVLEKCYKLKFEEIGRQGVIADDPICNFFNPTINFKTTLNPEEQQRRKAWEATQYGVWHKTNQGYKRLIEILLKTKLLR
jgi:hypothetical protein